VLDYQWPIAHGAAEILPGLLVVAALLGLTLHALVRSPRAGFLGALFFMVLAPTSSVMPLGDLAVEHRMYLPLAPVVAMAVLGCHALLRRADRRGAAVRWLAPALLAGAAVALGAATHARNALYLSPLAMWKDNIAKVPGSFRAHYNAGLACVTRGALDEGERYFAEANRLAGGDKDAEFNLGVIGAGRGDVGRAIAHYEAALRLAPDFLKAHVNLGNLRLALGDAAQAARHFEAALRKEPASFEANTSYGALLSRQGEWDRAAGCFGRAREARPGDAAAGLRYAEALLRAGRAEAAEEAFRAVLVASPGHPLALRGLEAIRASGR
jgi:tetratricopeptide (TPR) repeat protein